MPGAERDGWGGFAERQSADNPHTGKGEVWFFLLCHERVLDATWDVGSATCDVGRVRFRAFRLCI